MMLLVSTLVVTGLMLASAALSYVWATRNHKGWMEAGWDHLDAIAEIRPLMVKDWEGVFGETKEPRSRK
jgi:hypothetical protein